MASSPHPAEDTHTGDTPFQVHPGALASHPCGDWKPGWPESASPTLAEGANISAKTVGSGSAGTFAPPITAAEALPAQAGIPRQSALHPVRVDQGVLWVWSASNLCHDSGGNNKTQTGNTRLSEKRT